MAGSHCRMEPPAEPFMPESDLPEGLLPGESPVMAAVRLAMQAALDAALAREQAKAVQRGAAGPLDRGDDDWEVIADTAVDRYAFERATDFDAGDGPVPTYSLEEDSDIAALVAELDRTLPDLPGEETHGDLVIQFPEQQNATWYELAAEEALPAALRDIPGSMDVKRLLTALLVEIGDVKRTNAMLMEILARIEEKVDRTNRSLRPKGS